MKNFIRLSFLLIALSLVFGLAVAQQHEAAKPAQTGQSQAEPQQNPSAPPSTASPEEDLTQASEAAAKHESLAKEEEGEEENAALKYSPMVSKAGHLIGLSPRASYWLFTLINFGVVALLVIWLIKSKVLVAMRDRTQSIRSAIDAAKKTSEEANARLAEIENRLSKLDSEVAKLTVQAEADFSAEEQRIKQTAAEDAQRVVQAAEQEIASAAKAARRELKIFAAELTVNLAEKKISVDSDTDERLVRTFVEQLGKDGK